MKWIKSIALAAVLFTTALVSFAQAEELTFFMQSNYSKVVSLEFYSQDRNAAWPGDGQVYVLEDYDMHSFSLKCEYDEKICYGAWVRNASNTYWGVGLDNSESCSNCCYFCDGGETEDIFLDP